MKKLLVLVMTIVFVIGFSSVCFADFGDSLGDMIGDAITDALGDAISDAADSIRDNNNDSTVGDLLDIAGAYGDAVDAIENEDYEGYMDSLADMIEASGNDADTQQMADAYRAYGDLLGAAENEDAAGMLSAEANLYEILENQENREKINPNHLTGVNFYGIDIGWNGDYSVKYAFPGYGIYPFGADNADYIQIGLNSGQVTSLQDFMTDEVASSLIGAGDFSRLDTVNENCPYPAILTSSQMMIYNPYLNQVINIQAFDSPDNDTAISESMWNELIASVIASPINYTDAEMIKKVQEMLNAAGYDCGVPDGNNGPNTQAVISRYKTDKGLGESADITPELLTSLGITASIYDLPVIEEGQGHVFITDEE